MAYQPAPSKTGIRELPDHQRRDYVVVVRMNRQEYDGLMLETERQDSTMSAVLRQAIPKPFHQPAGS